MEVRVLSAASTKPPCFTGVFYCMKLATHSARTDASAVTALQPTSRCSLYSLADSSRFASETRMLTHIHGGRLVDPSLGNQSGKTATLSYSAERIVAAMKPGASDRLIDASGCLVMAGAIDLHTHIGGGKVTLARMLLENELSTSVAPFLPTAADTGARYLDMGYTTCFEPAVIPCNARSAHAEMADVAGLDTGGYCLLGNDDCLLRMISAGCEQQQINDYVAWMVTATQCIAVKVVNPGGISAFKFNVAKLDVDTPHPIYGITPATIIRVLCRAVHEIGLAHPLHVHCSNLGAAGNIESTLATIDAANGLPIHLTHAQFHCYGNKGPHGISSAAERLVDAMCRHPNVTIDVGQIMFGQTVTISADCQHQFANRSHAQPRRTALVQIECEAGCGVVPFRYRNRQYVHSLQWAIGLELFLMIDNPARVFLTTDHPNGAPFTSYPHLIRLLGDRSFRETALAEIHSDAAASCSLRGLSREYSLDEIAMMTRHAPARILGLGDIGNLQPGSLADIVIYDEPASVADLETVFTKPKYVIRRGETVRGPGAADRVSVPSITRTARPNFDLASVRSVASQFDHNGTRQFDRLWISDDELAEVMGTQPVGSSAWESRP